MEMMNVRETNCRFEPTTDIAVDFRITAVRTLRVLMTGAINEQERIRLRSGLIQVGVKKMIPYLLPQLFGREEDLVGIQVWRLTNDVSNFMVVSENRTNPNLYENKGQIYKPVLVKVLTDCGLTVDEDDWHVLWRGVPINVSEVAVALATFLMSSSTS